MEANDSGRAIGPAKVFACAWPTKVAEAPPQEKIGVSARGNALEYRVRKPGERVSETGIYRVEHASHRLMHQAILTAGMLFPKCRVCRCHTRFALIRPVKGAKIPFRSTEILVDYREPRTEAPIKVA